MNENSKLLTERNSFIFKETKDNHALLVWVENEKDITKDLQIEGIELLYSCAIKWSDNNYYDNYYRLTRICRNNNELNMQKLKDKKIEFVIFKSSEFKNKVLNIKGELKQTNNALIKCEEMLQNNNGILDYMLSYDYYEFNALTILCLGYKEFIKINNNDFNNLTQIISKDIEGSNGWETLSSLYCVLNYSCSWLVLRNYEEHSNDYIFGEGDDIDMQCENIEKFTAIMNAKNRPGGRCAYSVTVNKMNIPLDIRFIGDKYYDPVWEKDMLNRRQYKGIVPVLSEYDYFFALLYHIKLQKKFIKEVYVKRLDFLKKEIGLIDIPDKFVYDDNICADLLNSFLISNNYHYTYTDNAVRNEEFVKFIKRQEINDLCSNCKVLIKSLVKKCKKEFIRLPSRIKNKILRLILKEK